VGVAPGKLLHVFLPEDGFSAVVQMTKGRDKIDLEGGWSRDGVQFGSRVGNVSLR
jgi:hypothetical protein